MADYISSSFYLETGSYNQICQSNAPPPNKCMCKTFLELKLFCIFMYPVQSLPVW
uniref:Uncharacterized protein n=1 Tax=Setaria italica TaxID=4555 RepID=K4AHY0_SETIT